MRLMILPRLGKSDPESVDEALDQAEKRSFMLPNLRPPEKV